MLGLGGADRALILRQLVAPLVADGVVTDVDLLLRELEAREGQVTTQIATGVAFPHARSTTVRRLALTVGMAPEPGLLFSGPERERCRLFFLIAVPASAPTAHLPLLKQLCAIVRQGTHLQRLLEAQTPAQLSRLLTTAKG